ncbi:hypothetical protein [Lacrimispora sp.]|uniref:hypothetical protein n=1 Tax=Lacrimispora sp. TaxID=2719234 RepID=UPI0039922A95
MALTKEFVEAVSHGNLLRVRIMLKDSLLVDTSFNQFNEMLHYAESRLNGLWISNEEDDEVFSQSTEDLNNILVGLVNSFSKRRINHLMGLIHKMYPPKPAGIKNDKEYREQAVVIKRTRDVVMEMNAIFSDKKKINETCSKIVSKNQMDTSEIRTIRESAMSIIKHCDNISGK